MKKMTLEVREYGDIVHYVCDRAASVHCDACKHSHTVYHVVVKKGRVTRAIWDSRMGLRYVISGDDGDQVAAKDVFSTKHEAIGARHEKLAQKLAAGREALALAALAAAIKGKQAAKAAPKGKAVEG